MISEEDLDRWDDFYSKGMKDYPIGTIHGLACKRGRTLIAEIFRCRKYLNQKDDLFREIIKIPDADANDYAKDGIAND